MSFASGTTLWNLAGWSLLAAGIILALWALFWDRPRGRLRCPRCWYRVEGVPISLLKFHKSHREAMKCPECGEVIREERMLLKTRRRWWPLVPAVILLMLAPQAWEQPSRITDKETWQRAIPTWLYVFGGFSSDDTFKDNVEADIKNRRTRVNAFGRAWMDYWWEQGLWKEAKSKLYVPKKVRVDAPFVACVGTPIPDTYRDPLVDSSNFSWKQRRVGVVTGEALRRQTGSAPAWDLSWSDSWPGTMGGRAVMPAIENTGTKVVEIGLLGWSLDGRLVITSTTREVLAVASYDEAIPSIPDSNMARQLKEKVRLRIVKGRLYQEIVEVDFSDVILGQSCVSLRVELMQGKALVGGSKALLLSESKTKMYFQVAQPFLRELIADINAPTPAFSWRLQMNDNNGCLQGQAVCESAWVGSLEADAIEAARR